MRHDLFCCLALALAMVPPPALAQATAPSPSSAREHLPPGVPPNPESVPYAPAKPGSPVVQSIMGSGIAPLVVRKHAHAAPHHRHHRYAGPETPLEFDRPALAGVTLLQPLPPAPQPPHIAVPMPEYPLDTVAAAFLTPPPPIVCHRTPRIRDLPDPGLYRETTLVCEPDNP